MKKYLSIIILFLSISVFAQQNIEEALFDLPDVRFENISKKGSSTVLYECFVKQPIDHKDESKGHFYQKVHLTHAGFDAPTVMNTNGYYLNSGKNEVATILDANYINIEHRFFGKSVPEPKDWKYLTLEQATADLHHINQLFKKIYTKKWVSTGISKGGQTTIFYRYFYPNDVDVSMPYVAPLNLDFEDKRIYKFLDTIGTKECRNKIFNVQKTLLENREEVLLKLSWFSKGAAYEFEYLDDFEKAFEFAVLEYPFSFWQWGSDCNDLPNKGDDLDQFIQSFLDIVGLSFYDDKSMDLFAPHYYQASTQMGYYGFETKKLKKLIKALPKNPHASFAPKDAGELDFSNKLPKQVNKWLKKNGNNFVYIYGAKDTWSATRVIPSDKVNALYYHMPNRSHGDARIKNLTNSEKQQLEAMLEKWLGEEVDMSKLD